MLRKASIPALRQQIDRIDDQLLRLLSRRGELALAIAEQKARSNSEVYAPAREKGVLERLARANPGPLPAHLVRAVFREIISASRSLEQRLRIAYLARGDFHAPRGAPAVRRGRRLPRRRLGRGRVPR